MRACLILLCLLAAPAQAQWIEFTPCGKKLVAIEDFDVPVERLKYFSGPAQELEVVWVWTPAISAIVGYRLYEGEAVCTAILIGGIQQLYVIGDVNTVVDRIKKIEDEYSKRKPK